MKILVVGATGNLGRQVVRRALDEGHEVRCMIRNRERAQFLEQWGAQLFVGDLREPEAFESMLTEIEGVAVVASALANRDYRDKTNSIETVDNTGIRQFLDASRAAGVQHLVFTSMLRCDEFPDVRMMAIKRDTETYLERSGMSYTVLRLSGFMQGLISEYALPIMEKKPVRISGTPSSIAYISSVDVARFVVAAFTTPAVINKIHGVSGLQGWMPREIIDLCDELAGVKQVPKVSILSAGQKRINELIAKLFNTNLLELLRFSEVYATGGSYEADMEETCQVFGVPKSEIEDVETYLRDYFTLLKRRLREKNYQEPKVRSPF